MLLTLVKYDHIPYSLKAVKMTTPSYVTTVIHDNDDTLLPPNDDDLQDDPQEFDDIFTRMSIAKSQKNAQDLANAMNSKRYSTEDVLAAQDIQGKNSNTAASSRKAEKRAAAKESKLHAASDFDNPLS